MRAGRRLARGEAPRPRGVGVGATGAPAREAALAALGAVYAEGRSLERSLPEAVADLTLGQDRAFAQQLCYGVLRHAPRLEALLDQLLARPLRRRDARLRVAMLLGLYQLVYLDTPPHAAVAATLGALEREPAWARGLVNGVLRRFARERGSLLARADAVETARLEHPAWLVAALRDAWPDDLERIATANNRHPPMSLRVNQRRAARAEYAALLTAAGLDARPIAHCPQGLTLATPCDVDVLPRFHDGWCSVQDGAAQLVTPMLAPAPRERVLDLCAAPGGKTTHLLELEPSITVTAVDVSRRRLARLEDNLRRCLPGGERAVQVVHADAGDLRQWWDGLPYDRVLLDAPCTGSGVIRRHPDIKVLRRAQDVAGLAEGQRRLLDAAWRVLARGGTLLYATCSILPEENAAQISRFLQRHEDAEAMPRPASWGRPARDPTAARAADQAADREGYRGRQILPGDDDMDGFYCALVRKR